MSVSIKRAEYKRSFAVALTFLFFCFSAILNAQGGLGGYIDGIEAPTPKAQALGKYIDQPVSYHTGTPSVSMPIYTVQEGPLTLPIGVNYHASGIKVEEVASRVGIGWSLNAGGMISRSVRGLPDDAANGYLDNGYIVPADENAYLNPGPARALLLSYTNTNGDEDLESDMYTFSFGGYSGKFQFKVNGVDDYETVLVPRQDILIEPIPISSLDKTIIGFEATTPNGVKYTFGKGFQKQGQTSLPTNAVEAQETGQFRTTGPWNSWYLTKIETGDASFSIKLHYKPEMYAYDVLSPSQFRKTFWDLTPADDDLLASYGFAGGGFNDIGDEVDCGFVTSGSTIRAMYVDGVRLDEIEYSSGGVQFIPTGGDSPSSTDYRKDIRGNSSSGNNTARALEAIDIQISNNICKRYEFITSYFEDEASIQGLNNRPDQYRLKLEEIREKTCSGSGPTIPAHKFEYFGQAVSGNNPAQFLPRRLSRARDYWGYYNGKHSINENNSASLVPEGITVTYPALGTGNDVTISAPLNCAADRSVGTLDQVRTGTLKKHIYPTGGHTSYEFSQHSASRNLFDTQGTGTLPDTMLVGGLRIRKITSHEPARSEDIVRYFSYQKEDNGSQITSGVLVETPTFAQTRVFSDVNGPVIVQAQIVSDPIIPLSNYDGRHIVYDQVTEIWPGSGKKELTFEPYTYGVEDAYPVKFPLVPKEYDPRLGEMKLQLQKNETGNTVQSSSNDGTKDRYGPTQSQGNGTAIDIVKFQIGNSSVTIIGWSCYTSYAPAYFRDEEIKTLDGVPIQTTYTYGSNNYVYPTERTFTDSEGRIVKTTYKYPEDLLNNTDPDLTSVAVAQSMNERNILLPLLQETFVGNTKVSGRNSVYDFSQVNGVNYPYLKEISLYRTTEDGNGGWTDDWEPEVKILAYDRGLPTEVELRGWVQPEVLEWTISGKVKSRSRTSSTVNSSGNTVNTQLKTTYSYEDNDASLLLSSITSPDNQTTNFIYDGLGRLNEQSARNGEVSTTYEYHYATTTQLPTTPNYVRSSTTYGSPTEYGSLSDLTNHTTSVYLDGLGREIQTVRHGYHVADNGSRSDVVVTTEYDDHHRVEKTFEPIAKASGVTTGAYYPTYTTGDYTETSYYPDQLGRVQQITHSDFNHPITYEYGVNSTTINMPNSGSVYSFGTLNTVSTNDGNGNQNITYTTNTGLNVLMERNSSGGSGNILLSATHHQYDLKNRLQTVFPPYDGNLSNYPAGLWFSYKYDEFDRVVEKDVPDRETEKYAYDNRDLLIGIERSGLPNSRLTMSLNYDGFGRVLEEGLSDLGLPTNGTPNVIDPNDLLRSNCYGVIGAEWGKIKLVNERLLTENGLGDFVTTRSYYDSYGRLESTAGTHHRALNNFASLRNKLRYDLADNILHSEFILNFAPNDPLEVIEEMKIDVSGRVVESYHQTVIDDIDGPRIQTGKLNYTPKDEIKTDYIGFTSGGNPLVTMSYLYSGNGLLKQMNAPASTGNQDLFNLSLFHDESLTYSGYQAQLNGNISAQSVTTLSGEDFVYTYGYDGLDRLVATNYTDNANTQNNGHFNTAYSYDVRGNLESVDRFGAISTNGTFTYGQIDDLTYTYVGSNNSNQLLSVTDAITTSEGEAGYQQVGTAPNFTYDVRGNLEVHPGNGTQTNYNHLDLPRSVNLPSGDRLIYVYSASGSKLQEIRKTAADDLIYQTDYFGSTQYRNDELSFTSFSNGRVVYPGAKNPCTGVINLDNQYTHVQDETLTGQTITSQATVGSGASVEYYGETIELNSGFNADANFTAANDPCDVINALTYEYFITDHLGNTRLQFTDKDGDGNIEPEDVINERHYYAFGMEMTGDWQTNEPFPNQRYRYNGIERNDELGLDLAFYRSYDLAIGRWLQIDPKAESFATMSPYTGMGNNPISIIDPMGDSIRTTFYDADGNVSSAIPKVIQQMFNQEYGITVAYNASTGMLYQSGETETENTVSEPGKAEVVAALGEGVASTELVVGHNLYHRGRLDRKGKLAVDGGEQAGKRGAGVALIDLADFKSDGSLKGAKANKHFNPRSLNLGRTFEHEYFGHGLAGYGGGKLETQDVLHKPGGTGNVGYINRTFRAPASIPTRRGYLSGGNSDRFSNAGVLTYRRGANLRAKNFISTSKYY